MICPLLSNKLHNGKEEKNRNNKIKQGKQFLFQFVCGSRNLRRGI
uniref:Uncharacterized protein n=1 Tax=Arundo donax TaxID=35708 RepID=A0A0A8Y737_ARUDO